MPELRPPADPLADELVELRPWRDDDASELARVLNDPEVARWTSTPQPYGERDGLEWIASRAAEWRHGRAAAFAVLDAVSGRVIGSVELVIRDWDRGIGEVAYAIAAEDRGRGVATRAVGLVARWALLDVGLARLELLTHVGNAASQRVATKAGFARKGVMRAARVIRGEAVDLVVFVRVDADAG